MASFAEALAQARKAAESEFLAKINVLGTLADACDRAQEKLPDDDAHRRWAAIALDGFKAQLATILAQDGGPRPTTPPPAYVEKARPTPDAGPATHKEARPVPTQTTPPGPGQVGGKTADPTPPKEANGRKPKAKAQSWADVAGEASEAEFTEVKRKQVPDPKPTPKKKEPKAGQPGRVLLRLPGDHPLKGSAAGLKLELARVLDLTYDQILYAGFTKTGVAVRLAEAAGDALQLCTSKGLPAEPDGGHAFFCKGVPSTILAHNGPRDITPLLAAEVRSATGQDLLRSVRTAKGLVVVLRGPAKPFRLFGSPPSVPMKDRVQVRQCENCFGFHDTLKCYSAKRCRTCGSNKTTHDCGLPQCPNCLGPHGPTFAKCPARPTVNNGHIIYPSPQQRAAFRSIGSKERGLRLQAVKATPPERPFDAFIQTTPPGLAASRHFREEVQKLKTLRPSKESDRCQSEQPGFPLCQEMDVCGFSEADVDEVLNVHDLDTLKREFRDENEKLAEVYHTDESLRARRSREPSPEEIAELLNQQGPRGRKPSPRQDRAFKVQKQPPPLQMSLRSRRSSSTKPNKNLWSNI